MSSFFDSGPLPDLKEIKKWLGKELPWELVEQWDKAKNDTWLNDFIQKLMNSVKPDAKQLSAETASHKPLRIDISKSDKYVNVSLWLPPGVPIKELRVFATPDRIKLTGLPNDRSQTVKLPVLVLPRSGKAELKGERMLVRFRRRPAQRDEVELFLRE